MTNDRTRPDLDDTTVEGLGKLSEALETVEQARGLLYGFHQLTGKADLLLQDAVDLLRSAGHEALADDLERDLVGRNVDRRPVDVPDRRGLRRELLVDLPRASTPAPATELADGDRHVFEARMKQRERTAGHPRHEAGPALAD